MLRGLPINTLNTNNYVDVYTNAFNTRCAELSALGLEYKGLVDTENLSTNNDLQTDLMNYIVIELDIMKVDIDNKYTILPSSDPNKANALTIKNTVNNYYTEAVTLQSGFTASTHKTDDLGTVTTYLNNTSGLFLDFLIDIK